MRDRLRRLERLSLVAVAAAGVAAVALIAVIVVTGARDDDEEPAPPPRPAGPVRKAGARPSFLRRLIPSQARALPGTQVPRQLERAVREMPLERKVAQTMLVGFGGSDPSAPVVGLMRRRGFGGVVFGEGNFGGRANAAGLSYAVSMAAFRRRGEPPLVLAEQDGGDFNALPGLPPDRVPADQPTAEAAGADAGASARGLGRLGLTGVLGPPLDVGPEDGGAVGELAFSDDPEEVSAYARATLPAYRRAGLLAAPEHFPGVGGASQPLDEGPAKVGLSLEQLRARDLAPFREAVRAGAPAVVIGNASYVTDDFVVPGSMSRAVVTDLLRGGLGFRGVAISGDLTEPAVTATTPLDRAAVEAIRAGCDMIYVAGPRGAQEEVLRELVKAVRRGTIPRARIDSAVTRILTLKRELGLAPGRRPRRPRGAALEVPEQPPATGAPQSAPPSIQPGAP